MMALRRTALLPPGWGPGRPRRTSIGASSAVGVVAGGAGMLLARGRGSGVAQIVFRQLRSQSRTANMWRRERKMRTMPN
eukprot:COSAG02_NODE_92_length_37588_cov_135.916242_4_plen_79_part_00